jgi:hypothetical protein
MTPLLRKGTMLRNGQGEDLWTISKMMYAGCGCTRDLMAATICRTSTIMKNANVMHGKY